MHVNGLGSVPNVPSSQPGKPSQPADPQPPTEEKPSEEELEIPGVADSGERDAAPDARALRLAQIKAAIEAGEYDTDDKLDAALSRMFDEIGRDDD